MGFRPKQSYAVVWVMDVNSSIWRLFSFSVPQPSDDLTKSQ